MHNDDCETHSVVRPVEREFLGRIDLDGDVTRLLWSIVALIRVRM